MTYAGRVTRPLQCFVGFGILDEPTQRDVGDAIPYGVLLNTLYNAKRDDVTIVPYNLFGFYTL